MALEWLDGGPSFYARCWDKAAELTEAGQGSWIIKPGVIGWRMVPGPGSGYPARRALTLPGLSRRLASAASPAPPNPGAAWIRK